MSQAPTLRITLTIDINSAGQVTVASSQSQPSEISENPQSAPPPTPGIPAAVVTSHIPELDLVSDSPLTLLMKCGVATAAILVETYTEKEIRRAVVHGITRPAGPPKNLPGWIVSALRKGWFKPKARKATDDQAETKNPTEGPTTPPG